MYVIYVRMWVSPENLDSIKLNSVCFSILTCWFLWHSLSAKVCINESREILEPFGALFHLVVVVGAYVASTIL